MNQFMTRFILWLLVLGLAAPAYAGPNTQALLADQPPNVVVGPGDTLARLGVRFRLKPEDLARANGLSGPEAVLEVGQVLVIPAPAAGSGLRGIGPNHAAALAALPPPAQLNHLGTPRIVMADYMAWYNPTTFDGTQTFDLPASGPYYSSDLATVKRHLAEARRE